MRIISKIQTKQKDEKQKFEKDIVAYIDEMHRIKCESIPRSTFALKHFRL